MMQKNFPEPNSNPKHNTTMNETERELTNHMTAMQGEAPKTVNGHNVRRVDIESLSVLQLVGSPFAATFTAALNGAEVPAMATGPLDIAMLTWVHAEDPDTVLRTALQCAPGMAEPAQEAALRFVRGWEVTAMLEVIAYAMDEKKALQASRFNMEAPDFGGGAKKNPTEELAASPC